MTYKTNYLTAVNWFNNRRILLNNIQEIDPKFTTRFAKCETIVNDYGEEEWGEPRYIYNYWMTDCTLPEVQFLEAHFGLLFGYSELLQKYILCVDHRGTKWENYIINTDLESAKLPL